MSQTPTRKRPWLAALLGVHVTVLGLLISTAGDAHSDGWSPRSPLIR